MGLGLAAAGLRSYSAGIDPAGLGLKSRESHGDGTDRLRESRKVDGELRDVIAVGLARYLLHSIHNFISSSSSFYFYYSRVR